MLQVSPVAKAPADGDVVTVKEDCTRDFEEFVIVGKMQKLL